MAGVGSGATANPGADVWEADSDGLPPLEDWGPPEMPEPGELPPVALSGGPPGSNAWAVDGSRSSTGKPLLANDPHMFPRFPSVFYEAHLAAGGDLNVAGGGGPGPPGILIGPNRPNAGGRPASLAATAALFRGALRPHAR